MPADEIFLSSRDERAGWVSSPQHEDLFAGKDIEWLGAENNRDPSLLYQPFAHADCLMADVPPARVVRNRLGAPSGRVHMFLVLEGEWDCEASHGRFTQHAGDITLVDEGGPLCGNHPNRVRFLRWNLPRQDLTTFAPDFPVGGGAMVHLEHESGITRMLAGTMSLMSQNAGALDPTQQERLLLQLSGLVAQAVEEKSGAMRGTSRHGLRAMQRHRILTYVEARASDPELNARSAARDLDISRRWLHALLEGRGESFGELVARRRLERALRLLRDPNARHMRIVQIAHEVGFRDLSTFNRRFRGFYGVTPRQVRDHRHL